MASNVFVLGAGASVHAGTPTMATFFNVAEDLFGSEFEDFFSRLGRLGGVYSKAFVDLDNMEEVFGLLEMGQILGRLGPFEGTEVDDLRTRFVGLISRTLERCTVLYDGDGPFRSGNMVLVSARAETPYAGLVELITNNQMLVDDTAIISFNYDVALDYAVYRHARGFGTDYGFGDKPKRSIPLLKLHGSLNWARCAECGAPAPIGLRTFMSDIGFTNVGDNQISLPILDNLNRGTCPQGHRKFDDVPFIVPPTWNKTAYQTGLSQIWMEAARHLSSAKRVFIVGYSLPKTDAFFKYLFAAGTMSETRLRNFVVVNIDESARPRFEGILSEAVRRRFEYRVEDFESFINDGITGYIETKKTT